MWCFVRTMNFTLLTAFVYFFSWISASVSEFHIVEVQHGEDVTLDCTNFTSWPSHIHWFKLGSGPNITCISSMISADTNTTFCDGFKNDRFTMTSSTETVFLNIKHVDLFDSGLYFCGNNCDGKPMIVHATYLKVTQEMFGALITVILSGLIIFLIIVIIGLVIKIISLHKAPVHGQNPQHSQTLGSDNLNYAAVTFKPKPRTNHRPASQTQLEPDNAANR
ncbi:uncharacterized protein LOC129603810 isoform X2 [Betta splendens]|uniref:Uncharacterized protein LOC129603810 isoform X2 n=1 Tax=Betta splendens TaxID=158456 RepID=A0A9W2XMU2_BETSP|nr:uncharacterized protein LOC129603810 isoform X2 [Betta splendens]